MPTEIKDNLTKELENGFDGVISLIVKSKDENPNRIVSGNVEHLGWDLYCVEATHEDLITLSSNVDSIERNGTGKAL